jgi:cation:H+ antiporter
MDLFVLGLSFVVILVGAELFTNGIEWLGHKLGLSEGAVGSVLAAIGTALPETTIPLIAILFSGGAEAASHVGVGAVLGAPFMLATLALFICGATVLLIPARRRAGGALEVDRSNIVTDIRAFVVTYAIAIGVAFLPGDLAWPRWLLAVVLIGLYVRYVVTHLSAERTEGGATPGKLRFQSLDPRTAAPADEGHEAGFGLPHPSLGLVVVQVVIALGAIVLGATLFVGAIDSLTASLGIDPTLLALVIAPIATELPEAVNGIIWIRQGKDGLALGNITGALVFQAAIPTSIALVFATSHWLIDSTTVFAFASAGFAFAACAVVFLPLFRGRGLAGRGLLIGGLFYVAYVALVAAHLAGWLG